MEVPRDIVRPTEEDEELAEALTSLANPIRLAILRSLRSPKALKEIRVGHRQNGNEEPRILSRQGVRQHLLQLADLGVASTRPAEREYGETVEYLLSQSTLFAIAERFRDLASMEPAEKPQAETLHRGDADERAPEDGPVLVLVRGMPVGNTFDLGPSATARPPWTVGRQPEAEIALTYDPFVSSRNAQLVSTEDGLAVEDLPESRNGTRVNFRPLAEDETWTLSTGDLIGVGRSLLMFRA